jgi:hypothetical protein
MPRKPAAKPPAPEPAPVEAPAAAPEPQLQTAVEDLLAPELFAFEAQSISLVQGMISIALASARYDNTDGQKSMKKVVVGRVVMTPAGALNMAVRLFALLDKHGLGAAPKDPQKRQ